MSAEVLLPGCSKVEARRAFLAVAVEFLKLLAPFAGLYICAVVSIQTLLPEQYGAQATGQATLVYSVLRWGLLLEIFRRYFNDRYVFDEQRIIHKNGALSLRYKVSAVKYEDIREVRVDQSILARACGYGDIMIGTAGTSGYEVVLSSVHNAQAVLTWIQEMKVERIFAYHKEWTLISESEPEEAKSDIERANESFGLIIIPDAATVARITQVSLAGVLQNRN